MRSWPLALPAGFIVAALVAGFPASAADTPIATQANDTWNPSTVTIAVGDSVTWSNPTMGFHNVCVSKPGTTPGTCDEFRNGDPGGDWSGQSNSHVFSTAGTYRFICQIHGTTSGTGMAGTITVGDGGGTTTTPPPQPTDTTPPPPTQTGSSDTTAPHFTGRLTRHSGRRALVIDLGSSEDATLDATVSRRLPGARSFTRVGHAKRQVLQGPNTVTLPRRASGRLRSGSYKVALVLVDPSGNRSATKTLSFKLT